MLLKMLQDTEEPLALRRSWPAISAGCRRGWPRRSARPPELSPRARPRDVHGQAAEALYKAIQATKIMAPPTNCLSPIGEQAILSGLYQQIKGEFYTAVSRPPSVYRGNPFVIEAGLAYGQRPGAGGSRARRREAVPLAEGEEQKDDHELARVIRYANRVPLLYQQSACVSFKAVLDTTWQQLRRVPVARRAAGRADGDLRPHGLGLGAVHQRVQGSDRRATTRSARRSRWRCASAAGGWARSSGGASERRARFRRRNIFELYIEEVVAVVQPPQGGRLPTAKLKEQLQRMALKRTGGEKTDELLGRNGSGPEGLPHSIIVTPEGVEGEVPVLTRASAPRCVRERARRPEAGGAPKVDGAREAKAKTKKAARRMPRAGRTKARTPTRRDRETSERARRRKA